MQNDQFSESELKIIRKFVFDKFVETSHAPPVEQIMKEFDMSRNKVESIFQELEKQGSLVVQPSSNKILMLHPFSNIPTCWVVKPDRNTTYYANCAWDAIAMHFSLHKDIDIESFCYYCNRDIILRLEDGKFKYKVPESTFIVISKPPGKWWNDIVDTCGNQMNFFCSDKHLAAWRQEYNIEDNQFGLFRDKEVLELSRAMYSTKGDLDYSHISGEEEVKLFKELNLVGDFWESPNT